MADELVFIVDQNETFCKEITGWLHEIGFQTKTFEDTELCLNTIDQNPSTVCLDMNTAGSSGLSGLEFLLSLIHI